MHAVVAVKFVHPLTEMCVANVLLKCTLMLIMPAVDAQKVAKAVKTTMACATNYHQAIF